MFVQALVGKEYEKDKAKLARDALVIPGGAGRSAVSLIKLKTALKEA